MLFGISVASTLASHVCVAMALTKSVSSNSTLLSGRKSGSFFQR